MFEFIANFGGPKGEAHKGIAFFYQIQNLAIKFFDSDSSELWWSNKPDDGFHFANFGVFVSCRSRKSKFCPFFEKQARGYSEFIKEFHKLNCKPGSGNDA